MSTFTVAVKFVELCSRAAGYRIKTLRKMNRDSATVAIRAGVSGSQRVTVGFALGYSWQLVCRVQSEYVPES